jgi:hypothetical protein
LGLFSYNANLIAQHRVELAICTAPGVELNYIDDEDLITTIRNSKDEEFVQILMIEEMELLNAT